MGESAGIMNRLYDWIVPDKKFEIAKKNWARSITRVILADKLICSGENPDPVMKAVNGCAKIKMTVEKTKKKSSIMFSTLEAMIKASFFDCFSYFVKTGMNAAESAPITKS